MIVNKDDLDCAYEEGERMTEWPGAIRLIQKPLPSLSLPSGRIVASDPFTSPESPPPDLKVSPGRYPLVLTIAHIGDDQRIAFARLEWMASPSTAFKAPKNSPNAFAHGNSAALPPSWSSNL